MVWRLFETLATATAAFTTVVYFDNAGPPSVVKFAVFTSIDLAVIVWITKIYFAVDLILPRP